MCKAQWLVGCLLARFRKQPINALYFEFLRMTSSFITSRPEIATIDQPMASSQSLCFILSLWMNSSFFFPRGQELPQSTNLWHYVKEKDIRTQKRKKRLLKHLTHLTRMGNPNGYSQDYHLGQSIFVLRVVSWYFHLTFCKQTVETLIRRRVPWRLSWLCTVCLNPTKRTLGLYGLSRRQNTIK